jgi:predicted ATPase/class 3 adenylate cyclase
MTFEEILDQAIAMLQRRGRVTYRTLRLQFQLDEEQLEALKEALIDAERLAIDEKGRVLVWAGSPASPLTASASQDATQDNSPDQAPPVADVPATAAGQVPRPADAERRQLTVLFCDLVDSTRLASQLDPEEYREVVRAYQATCTEVIHRYDGYIAQLLGDGLLVYFGYPQAHEDDAHRAVRTGLGIVEAIGALNIRLKQDHDLQVAVRLGIHTGLVVVGEMGGGGRQEQLALGEVPNLAARLQGLAEPNTVAMSAATSRLVQGYFACQELGAQTLRGGSHPIAVYRVLQDSGAQSRLDVASTRGLTPLVGRESEVTLLLERWEQAKNGQGQVVLLTGEGGIGKSRLVQVLKEHIASEPHPRWECRSFPYYQNTALYPLTDLFQRALHWHQDDTPEEKLANLEQQLRQYRLPVAETVALFAPFLSLTLPEDRYPPLTLSPQRQRQKTLESIVAILLELAERQPVLFILEDLHWTDPTTLEFLGVLIDQTPTASLYLLLTCRPEFQPSWSHRSYLTEVTVTRLSREQIIRMAVQIAGGKSLPDEILQQIVNKTDGVPLFVEELTKAVLESGMLKDVNGQYEITGSVSALAIPATLHDSLMARLDRLVSAKGIAQLGAVIGRQFSYELLEAVSQLDAPTLQRELGRLVEAELLYQRGLPPHATYTFKHALIQETAYESLLRSTRQGYHCRIAAVIRERFPATVETQPEWVAHHYHAAGNLEQAGNYWQTASAQAFKRSAYVEAIAHATTGLAALHLVPDTPRRTRLELATRLALGPALMVTRGFSAPEVEQTYLRARALCEQLDDTGQLFHVLCGLRRIYANRGEGSLARQVGQECLQLARQVQDAAALLEAQFSLGWACMYAGDLTAAQAHLEQGMRDGAQVDARPSQVIFGRTRRDIILCSQGAVAECHWMLGYPDRARQEAHTAMLQAELDADAFSFANVLTRFLYVHQYCRDTKAVERHAEVAMRHCHDHQIALFGAQVQSQYGWALALQGQHDAGLSHLRETLSFMQTTGALAFVVLARLRLAEAYGTGGQAEEGLAVLAESLALVDKTGEGYYAAELYRLKGALLLQLSLDNQSAAEASFQKAIDVSRHQHAKSWELRAATSLARLWQQQGKRQEAHDLLAPIYGWFTEGFDTADLQDAKALLEALA